MESDYLEFKTLYIKFLKAGKYMAEKRLMIKDPDNPEWKALVETFFKKIVNPMEEAWSKLSIAEKRFFMPDFQRY